MKVSICHMTSVHPRYDGRIFMKECKSLLKAGYDVSLVVADGKGDEVKDGVKIYDVGTFEGRINRIFNASKAVYNKSLELNCSIYHFHDPELIFSGLKLKKKGKKVIFDMHENVPADIEEKSYIPKLFRKILSVSYRMLEQYTVKKIDGVVSTRDSINERISGYNKNIQLITNFPIIDQQITKQQSSKTEISFAGVVIPNWRHKEIINSIEDYDNLVYHLAGNGDENYLSELKQLKGWKNVQYEGRVPFDKVKEIYSKSDIGVAIYVYCKNMDGTRGNLANTKLFEYMNWGIPIICTDYSLWKEIIEDEVKCGICVNPYSESEIKKAIDYLLNNPLEAKLMGENGRKAAISKYNWDTQAEKLEDFYSKIVNG